MTNNKDYDHNLKILLIGNSGVGKSCLLMRFSEDNFTQAFLNTIGVDFKVKFLNKNGEKVKLVLWDTAGQERFRTITNSYYRGANGIIIVYDITDKESFENVCNWYDEMNKNINRKVACMLVGNKVDMSSRRVITFQQGQNLGMQLIYRMLAKKYMIPFSQTSAKTSENVNVIFNDLTTQIMRMSEGTKQLRPKLKPPIPLNRKNSAEQETCSCCEN